MVSDGVTFFPFVNLGICRVHIFSFQFFILLALTICLLNQPLKFVNGLIVLGVTLPRVSKIPPVSLMLLYHRGCNVLNYKSKLIPQSILKLHHSKIFFYKCFDISIIFSGKQFITNDMQPNWP